MRFRVALALASGLMTFVGNAFPTATSTGTFNVVLSATANWDTFSWAWNDQDSQQMAVAFTNAGTVTGATGIWFRLAEPERGTIVQTLQTGQLTISGNALNFSLTSSILPISFPAPGRYHGEFLLMGTNSESRSLAKGTVEIRPPLFAITNTATWTPIVIDFME